MSGLDSVCLYGKAFKIKPLKRENFIQIMNNIKQMENIEIDDDAQDFIINISNNTVKTIINYMEKFKLLNELGAKRK